MRKCNDSDWRDKLECCDMNVVKPCDHDCNCTRGCRHVCCISGPTGPTGATGATGATAPSIYAQHGNCRNHAAFHYLKDN